MALNNPYSMSSPQQRLQEMQQQQLQQQQFNTYNPYQQYAQTPNVQQPYQNNFNMPMQPQQMQQQQQSIIFECRPVTSVDEAKAVPPKWDGNPIIFVDSSNKFIYEKRLNINDGTAIFHTYKRVEEIKPEEAPISVQESPPTFDFSNTASKEDLEPIYKELSFLKNQLVIANNENNEMKSQLQACEELILSSNNTSSLPPKIEPTNQRNNKK